MLILNTTPTDSTCHFHTSQLKVKGVESVECCLGSASMKGDCVKHNYFKRPLSCFYINKIKKGFLPFESFISKSDIKTLMIRVMILGVRAAQVGSRSSKKAEA